jgi:hypothetical protein
MGKGCITAVSIVTAGVMLLGLVGQCSGPQNQLNRPVENQSVIATVAGKPILQASVQQALETQRQQMQQFMSMMGPEQEAGMVGQSISTFLRQAAIRSIAEKQGVDFSDTSVKSLVSKQLDEAIDSAVTNLKTQKKIKDNATAVEIEKAFKEAYQRTPKEIRDSQQKEISEVLADPARRDGLLNSVADPLLMEAERKKLNLSDADLKKAYDTYTVKKILLLPNPTKDPQAESKRILEEIKGGLKYEAAMNKYSQEPPQPGKTVSENTATVTGRQLESPEFAPIKLIKPGEVSLPAPSPQGLVIYKLVSVKSDLPADFEAKKADYKKQVEDEIVRGKIDREADAIVKSAEVRWNNKSFELLYDLGQLGFSQDGASRTKKLQDFAAAAKKLYDDPQTRNDLAALAWYSALSQLQMTASDAEKTAMQEDYKAALNAMLTSRETSQLRMKLVDLGVQGKNAEEASQNLLKVALYNSDVTQVGQALYGEIQAKQRELKEKNLLTDEASKLIDAELQRWRKDKVAFEKAQADAQKGAEKSAAPSAPAKK